MENYEKLTALIGTVVTVFITDQIGIMATVRGQLATGFAVHVKAHSGDFATVYFKGHDVADVDGNEIRICK